MLDLEAIRRTVAVEDPFPFFVARGVLDARRLDTIANDFPHIAQPGVWPLETLSYGPAFAALVEAVRDPALERLIGAKLGVDLAELPLMITVRGQCQRKDGRIHTDSTDKVATCLLYLNGSDWPAEGGRLRLLASSDDIDDVIAEVPPDGGTLVAFRRTDNSWHGHLPFEGPRRYVMFNWVRSGAALSRNLVRHRISAHLKRLNPFR